MRVQGWRGHPPKPTPLPAPTPPNPLVIKKSNQVYDYEYISPERGNFSKLVFVNWCVAGVARAGRRRRLCSFLQNKTKQNKKHNTQQNHKQRRAPDTAQTRTKMMYASTKDFLKGFLDGVGAELQATEPSELGEDEMRERVVSNMTRK